MGDRHDSASSIELNTSKKFTCQRTLNLSLTFVVTFTHIMSYFNFEIYDQLKINKILSIFEHLNCFQRTMFKLHAMFAILIHNLKYVLITLICTPCIQYPLFYRNLQVHLPNLHKLRVCD